MVATESPAVLARAERACGRAQDLRDRAVELTSSSRRLRQARSRTALRYFVLHGDVAGQQVRAVWSRGALMATAELRRRGDVVVALGERFEVPDTDRTIAADLTRPAAALLTMIRACDRVHDVAFGPVANLSGSTGSRGRSRSTPGRASGS